jgi:hypothetical protein
MTHPLVSILSFPDRQLPASVVPVVQLPVAAPKLPADAQPFTCPITEADMVVDAVIVEHDLDGSHAHHWYGCWSCAGLYWTPDMHIPIQKSWHRVTVAVTPEPTPADYLAQLITEFVAMRDIAEAALVDLPPDPDYHTHVDELIAQCRAVVQDLRDREARRHPRTVTVHT